MKTANLDRVDALVSAAQKAVVKLDRLRADICTESGLSWDQFAFSEDIDTIMAVLKTGLHG